jgi:hypothetical protein
MTYERRWRVAGLALAIAAVVSAAAPSADSQTAAARVYFLQGEQIVAVTRGGSTVRTARGAAARAGCERNALAAPAALATDRPQPPTRGRLSGRDPF